MRVWLHAVHPPPGLASAADSDVVSFVLRKRLAGLAAILADLVVIVVVYQALFNRMRRLPLGVPLYIALVVAMATDAVVYAAIMGKLLDWNSTANGLRLPQKLEAGFFAGMPLAAHLSWQLRRRATS